LSRSTAAEKARRLLSEGRVIITEARGRCVRAEVRGDSGETYEVAHELDGRWLCACVARGICSHVQAVQLVTAPVRIRRLQG